MYTTVNAGLYTRLSVEDENNQVSESIQTQKAMLTDYCREKGYRIVDYYVDDGETGTNFERPEFQRMLRDIEAGKINTVICKDDCVNIELKSEGLENAGLCDVSSVF